MPITQRLFPTAPVALLLLAAPLGCHSDVPSSAAPEAGGAAVQTRSAPTEPGEAPALAEAVGRVQPEPALRGFDPDVRQTAEVVEDGIGDLQGEMTRAVDDARGGVQGLAGTVREEATQAAAHVEGGVRQAVDQVVGGVQREVEGAQGDVHRRARAIRDDVKQSARGLKKNVVDGIFGPSEE